MDRQHSASTQAAINLSLAYYLRYPGSVLPRAPSSQPCSLSVGLRLPARLNRTATWLA
jgi:hypothetical protein